MRMLTAAAGAALLILAATPALASGPRGGGHHPQPPAPCCRGGGNTNVNVNVNAQARASAVASAGSYFNARAYDVGTFRGGHGGHGGGVIYVGGGYGGDGGGYLGGPVYYNDRALQGRACPSAPFGYIVTGFGRDDHRPSWCGYRYDERGRDRGGRYGYSERRDSYGESRYESYESYEEYEEYEAAAYYDDRDAYYGDDDYRDDYDRGDCRCRDDREPAPYPAPYAPEPPRYEPPRYEPLPPPPPARPYREPPPRQHYSQEPGERG